jgi:ABC-type Zn uptake system ZnuABC Zn-binding protein ZnuA
MKRFFNSVFRLLALVPLFLTACGSAPQSSDGTLRVLASTTFLADMAQNVAGDRLTVESLLPVGADPHAYQAVPSDVAKIAESNVLILNGFEYEHFIETLLSNAGGERLIVTASVGLQPDHMEEDGAQVSDPHMWLDPNRAIEYVKNIRDGLAQTDPAGTAVYDANAEAYISQLKDLDAWIKEEVDMIPVERRLLVTNHESMGYFAERYGFTVVDTILPSFSSEASASAQEIAASIELVKSSGAPAIFLSEVENADLADQIAAETNVKVISDLHLESLTNGAPAATYIDMMKYNVSRIVEALQ